MEPWRCWPCPPVRAAQICLAWKPSDFADLFAATHGALKEASTPSRHLPILRMPIMPAHEALSVVPHLPFGAAALLFWATAEAADCPAPVPAALLTCIVGDGGLLVDRVPDLDTLQASLVAYGALCCCAVLCQAERSAGGSLPVTWTPCR